MNREIKFRAWDDRKKRWLLGYKMPHLGGFSLWGETMLMDDWSTTLDQYIFERSGHNAGDLKVMEYTGIKDKNGNDIYEGDLLRWINWQEEQTEFPDVYKVEWLVKEARFVINCFRNGDLLSPKDENLSKMDNFEVIGNIYENGDLLCKKVN